MLTKRMRGAHSFKHETEANGLLDEERMETKCIHSFPPIVQGDLAEIHLWKRVYLPV